MDVSMPEIDGFELAELIRQHPRYQKTAIIFVSAVHLTDFDQLKGYAAGAVVINPTRSAHNVSSRDGCIVFALWEKPVIFEPA